VDFSFLQIDPQFLQLGHSRFPRIHVVHRGPESLSERVPMHIQVPPHPTLPDEMEIPITRPPPPLGLLCFLLLLRFTGDGLNVVLADYFDVTSSFCWSNPLSFFCVIGDLFPLLPVTEKVLLTNF